MMKDTSMFSCSVFKLKGDLKFYRISVCINNAHVTVISLLLPLHDVSSLFELNINWNLTI